MASKDGPLVTQPATYRRTNLRWSAGELDRLLRAVRLEDVTPPAERFSGISATLERSPLSVRAKWLELRNAALRGQPVASPAVAEYVRRRFPATALPQHGDDSLDGLIAEYREAHRRADALLERVFALAARDGEALQRLRGTLFGYATTQPEDAHADHADVTAAA
jgi:hypothetical protein